MALNKIFQTASACNNLYGLIAIGFICITIVIILVVLIHSIKIILLKLIETCNYIYAKFQGTSIQTEIGIRGKAAPAALPLLYLQQIT